MPTGGDLRRLVEVRRVGEDDVGRLAAEFEIDPLQVGAGRILEQLAPDRAGAGEDQHVDIHVQAECFAGDGTLAGDNVEHAVRQAGLGTEFGQPE